MPRVVTVSLALAGAIGVLWSGGFVGPNPVKERQAKRIQEEILSEVKPGMAANEARAVLERDRFTPLRMPEHKSLAGRYELPGEFVRGLRYERAIVLVA
jgi:hypothetical protein